MHRKIVFVKVE